MPSRRPSTRSFLRLRGVERIHTRRNANETFCEPWAISSSATESVGDREAGRRGGRWSESMVTDHDLKTRDNSRPWASNKQKGAPRVTNQFLTAHGQPPLLRTFLIGAGQTYHSIGRRKTHEKRPSGFLGYQVHEVGLFHATRATISIEMVLLKRQHSRSKSLPLSSAMSGRQIHLRNLAINPITCAVKHRLCLKLEGCCKSQQVFIYFQKEDSAGYIF